MLSASLMLCGFREVIEGNLTRVVRAVDGIILPSVYCTYSTVGLGHKEEAGGETNVYDDQLDKETMILT